MNIMLPVAPQAATPLVLDHDPVTPAAAILSAAECLLPQLERGERIDAAALRGAMESAFDASDATGAWDWKDAYEACEVATVLFLRKYGKALFRKTASPAARLSVLAKIMALLPTHTRRSEESRALQQFSTPVPLGLAALSAAAITPADRVLEPSAGIGLLAVLAETVGGALVLNELADTRADLLGWLFPTVPVTRFDAALVHDHLDAVTVPSVVLMNPPFSAMANVSGRVADAGFHHIASALVRLAPGGRLVAITGANVGPDTHPGTGAETRLLTIAERRRNRPMLLDDALALGDDGRTRLLVNERSGRAAVQVAAPSLMLDDGEIEWRVRLMRPMETQALPIAALADSHWQEVDCAAFTASWEAELAEVSAFAEHTLHVVAGLLLPVWKRLPNESTRVYRLQTDDGERIIGRRVSPAWAANAATSAPTLTPDQAFAALIEGRTILDLSEGLQLRRVRVMGANRIELTGFTEPMRDRLRAYGLFTEIISWKLRFFVPVDGSGPAVLARLLDTYSIQRLAEREAA